MKRTIWLYCGDLEAAGLKGKDCCTSCHSDADSGYPIMELEPPRNAHYKESRVTVECCCEASRMITELTRADCAQMLRLRRANR
jgi:hypothetical protein